MAIGWKWDFVDGPLSRVFYNILEIQPSIPGYWKTTAVNISLGKKFNWLKDSDHHAKQNTNFNSLPDVRKPRQIGLCNKTKIGLTAYSLKEAFKMHIVWLFDAGSILSLFNQTLLGKHIYLNRVLLTNALRNITARELKKYYQTEEY